MIKNKANLIIIILVTIVLVIILSMISLITNDRNIDNNDNEEVKIKSKVLQEVIESNWDTEYDFGTKDSKFDEYNIFFDEGIEVKNVEDKIYNIVFTEKYKKNIINNIKANDNLNDIIQELGQPHFGGKSIELIGYKIDNIYIFFNGSQASIYRNDEENIKDKYLFESVYQSALEFSNSLVDKWNDYDIYIQENVDNIVQYSLINYANKGIRISIINDKIDITVYNNCNFKVPENNIYNIKVKNKNLIYEVEIERQNSVHNREYAYEQYQSTINNLPPDFDNEEQIYKIIKSKKFIESQNKFKSTGEYKLLFISIDGKYSNSEIDEYVTSNLWLDDYNIAYGVRNKGLYIYNVKTREKIILKEGAEDYIIHGLTNDNILEYDNSSISINI